ncbi:Terpene cyclase/mutase family protein [Sulfidibacter corallicola]|uniref:Terpene cyclase/mutase family protein n=1 Tax=Sulfidibacter corallicola TaxID=2818388 RepID=A0A8A4TSH7_SULCO|nr:prenyltransferase/squalene oxidase repeat-containing protein [Sulfidibacter corallicola]QTD52463.1 terpene cyclase/mutase family protein [Sulfidibacter corallicola]
MSSRLEMLQVARLAPPLLSDAADLVRDFILSKQHPDGGFVDRGGDRDLYYSVFGLGTLLALQAEVDRDGLRSWLSSFGTGETLDLIHASALIRTWAGLGGAPADLREGLLARVEAWRTPDGGFNERRDASHGSAYGAFMALGAYQDLDRDMADVHLVMDSVRALATDDGGFANERDLPCGTTPALAAAESVLRAGGILLAPQSRDWLLARFGNGGFYAVPGAPMPDLLSTAIALHALSGMGADLAKYREPCLDYIDSLWVNTGGFYGNWGDEILDCEYTFYGMLALGHLNF